MDGRISIREALDMTRMGCMEFETFKMQEAMHEIVRLGQIQRELISRMREPGR
jgi:hypothetical protein